MKKYTHVVLSLMVLTLVMLPAFALADTTPTPSVEPTLSPTLAPTADPSASPTPDPEATPTAQPSLSPLPNPTQKPSGKDYRVEYKGGNTFATNNSAVPTSVEIDGVPFPSQVTARALR